MSVNFLTDYGILASEVPFTSVVKFKLSTYTSNKFSAGLFGLKAKSNSNSLSTKVKLPYNAILKYGGISVIPNFIPALWIALLVNPKGFYQSEINYAYKENSVSVSYIIPLIF